MLVLTRRVGERIKIGDTITLIVTQVLKGRVTLAFEAPDVVRIRLDEENKREKPSVDKSKS
jgi:carbon storage regulator CsrA